MSQDICVLTHQLKLCENQKHVINELTAYCCKPLHIKCLHGPWYVSGLFSRLQWKLMIYKSY